jgi:mannosyltransferase OCH1-like enzyme
MTSNDQRSVSKKEDPQPKIPKIIMQTWKNKDIPEKWKRSPKSIRCWMPTWKYVLMTDEDNRKFVERYFPDFLPYYDAFPYAIQRADAIRYCFLAIHGGIYMDLDMELLKPLDELFENDNELYLVESGNIGGYITNSFMASKPGCRIWYEMIEEMKKPLPKWAIGKHIQVMNSTGPIALNRVVKRSNIVYGALPRSYISPCSVCDSVCNRPGAYIRPLEGSSWTSWDTQVYNFFLCKWRILLIILGIVLIVWILSRGKERE